MRSSFFFWFYLCYHRVRFVHKILFLMPINDIRFTATRRRTVEMFGQFLRGSGDFYATIFVTTMWDVLCTQQARQRAELNFIQLRDEILEVLAFSFFSYPSK